MYTWYLIVTLKSGIIHTLRTASHHDNANDLIVSIINISNGTPVTSRNWYIANNADATTSIAIDILDISSIEALTPEEWHFRQ